MEPAEGITVAEHPDAFVTITKVVTEPVNTAAVLGILREIVALDAGEPGTLVQTVQVDRAAPSVIWLYELWASAEALEAHRVNGAGPRARLAPLISGVYEVHACTPLFGHGLDLEAMVRGT
jgi:quinol monooxygenase YgiN